MNRSAHRAAIDQARLLASYLSETPTHSLDLRFIRRHLDTLDEFAAAANGDQQPSHSPGETSRESGRGNPSKRS